MQYSIVKASFVRDDNQIFRYDADYFLPSHLALIRKVSSLKHKRIKQCFDVTKLAGFEYTLYFTPKNQESNNFYLAFTSKNIQEEELILDEALQIDKTIANQFLLRSKLINEDAILSYTGEYRRALVLQKGDFQLGPNICRLRNFDRIINPYYLSIYLNSKVGQQLLDREKTLSGQPTVAMSRIREIRIPILNSTIQNMIEYTMKKSYALQVEISEAVAKAKQIFLSSLGLEHWKPQHAKTFARTFSAVQTSLRMDGEHFQPKFDEMLSLIRKNAAYCKTIRNIKTFNSRGAQPKYFDDGTLKVINSQHILEAHLDYENFSLTQEKFWDIEKESRVFKNDILIYTTGANVGRANVYLEDERALASNHTNILRVKDENPIYVGFALNSIVGRMQTEKMKTGSAQAELYPSAINQFIVPFIDKKKQDDIAELYLASHQLSKQSKQLIEKAKRAVEIAIEIDEKAAMEYLNLD